MRNNQNGNIFDASLARLSRVPVFGLVRRIKEGITKIK